jgi:hypothetical protein
MNTEQNYPIKKSTLKLTGAQRAAAKALLERRPEVYPGTRAILNREEAVAWFHHVTAEMDRLGLPDDLVGPFCDVAGVPD